MKVNNSKLPDNYITSIACDAEGRTYVGTRNGILYWDHYAFILINTENSKLPENHITCLEFDHDGNLLIGTRNAGLFKGIGRDVKPFKLVIMKTTFNQMCK